MKFFARFRSAGGRLWFLLILALFLLPALLPLLQGGGLPCTHDNDLYYYRILALKDAFDHGWLFSRWIPNLALGYGTPFFNFREPIPNLLGALLYACGLSLPLTLGLVYAASLLAAGLGAYALARDLWGEYAGWVTGAAYALGPYLLVDALRRGNLPESVALALLPWLLLAFRRLMLTGRRGPFAAATALLAALFLSHNITALLFAPFLGGYALLLAWLHRDRRHYGWAFLAVGLALALTAWFWLPALLEQDTVQLYLARTTRNNDFHYNFITWAEMLLTVSTVARPDLLNPPMRIFLGLPQVGLAALGLAVGLRRWRREIERRAVALFLTGIALFYLWLGTSTSVGLWERLPLLSFVQFPWRLVGRALLPAALLAGVSFPTPASGCQSATRRWLLPVLLALLVISAWPETRPPKGFCPLEPHPTMARLYDFEQGGALGLDNEGSYLPIWVEQRPTNLTLAQAFSAGMLPERLERAALPPGAEVVAAEYGSLRAVVTVQTPEPFTARWLTFYYPGWQARIDGVPVAVAPETVTGMLTFSVPAGLHEITVDFVETPLRRAADFVGVGAVALWLLVILFPRSAAVSLTPAPFFPLSATSRGAVLLLALLLLFGKAWVYDRLPATAGLPSLSRIDTGWPAAPLTLAQPFDAGLTLSGYTLYTEQLSADAELGADLWWRVTRTPSVEYRTSIQLYGADGQTWSPAGTNRPRGYDPPSTSQWPPGALIYDPQLIAALPGTPPGEYTLVVSLFDRETLEPASVLGADGNPLGPSLALTSVTLERPAHPATLAALDVAPSATATPCGALGLWAFTADRAQAAPGELVGLRWVWEALATPIEALTATATLRAADGTVARAWELPPVAAWWPTTAWQTGERWVGRPLVRLPGGLASGDYTLEATLPGCGPLARVSLQVVAPARVWELPAGLTPLDAVFGGQARLAGYTLASADAGLQLTLAWQAVAEMDASYRVFVHLVDAEGHLAAQSDGEPVAWTRPTTGWAVGEVVTETRALALPADFAPGTYTLRVGLYLPDDPRLTLPDGQDAVVITVDARQ